MARRSGITFNPQQSPQPSLAMTKMEDFEHIISYLRNYIAICKEKRQFPCFSVLLKDTKDTNKLDDEQNKQNELSTVPLWLCWFLVSHRSPLRGKILRFEVQSICFLLLCFIKTFLSNFSKQWVSFRLISFLDLDQILH